MLNLPRIYNLSDGKTKLQYGLNVVEAFLQSIADNLNFISLEIIVEWQCDCAFAYSVGYWEIAVFIAELFDHKGLKCYRRKIVANAYTRIGHSF